MNENEIKFLQELTDLTYKYKIVIIKTADTNKIVPVEMNKEDMGGSYVIEDDELIFN